MKLSRILSITTGSISAVAFLITYLGNHFNWGITADVTFVAGLLSQFANMMFAVLTGAKGSGIQEGQTEKTEVTQ